MAGKTNLTATLFSQKKLLGKSQTGTHRADNQEPIPSGLQVAAQSIFSQDIPSSPSQTLYTVQSASAGKAATIEYVDFSLVAVTGSTYDANTFDPDASPQASGPHTYRLVMTGNYQALSDNARKGTGFFKDDQILHWSLGGLQLIPPTFSNDAPNPYILKLYSGSRDVDDEIPILDELDWQIDYYSGLLFLQDYDSAKIPTRARGFIYVGEMLSASLGASGGGTGTGVGWFGSGAGTISTTGSLLVGTNTATPTNSEISFSSVGAAVFNEQGRNSDFRVETTAKTHSIFVDASENQVLILSGGAATSTNEALGSDVNFYVSGTVGGREGSSRAITLFGGDIHISGNLTVGGTSPGGGGGGSPAGSNTQIQFNDAGSFGASSAFTFTGTEVALSAASPKYSLKRSSNDQESSLEFKGAAGNLGASISHDVVGNDLVLKTFGGASVEEMLRLGGYSSGDNRQVIFLSGSSVAASAMQPSISTDISFFVSGAVDSRGGTSKGTSVFGGDLAVSGTLAVNLSDAAVGSQFVVTTDGKVGIGTSTPAYKLSVGGNMDVGEYIYHKNDANTYIRFQNDDVNIQVGGRSMIKMREEASIDQVLIMSGNASALSPDPKNFLDTSFFVSGTIGAKDTSDPGSAVFGGDTIVSGSLTSNMGLSGSLTQLADGSSYLIAGSNINITSASNGSVTIDGTASGNVNFIGGSGNNNQMITADGAGNIVAESNITFTGSRLEVTGTILPGGDNLYNLGSETHRFANIYTGDLHLRNERGHWQIVEEAEYLTVINRLTGKRYKMVLEPMDNE